MPKVKEKKDKKTKAAEKKVRAAQKQDKKATQKEKKAKTKGGRGAADDSDDADADLDAILASYAKQQEAFLKVTETVLPAPPPPRSSATLLASPASANELLLFGGESYDGALASFYNDLLIYNIARDEWRQVTSPNSPLPRSGHAWTRGGNAGGVYLFGGEFSSPKQGTFHHYGDFWRLDPAAREWARIETPRGGRTASMPPARSGHRMTYFKQYVVLYGGFQDTARDTRYLGDVWVYDCANFAWHNPPLPPASQRPDPRSSCSLLPHERGAVLYGGYSRVKQQATKGGSSGKGGGGPATRTVLAPVVHQDTWFLRITPPAPDAPPTAPPMLRWEKRKRPANAPNPPRAGATMAHHKGRGVLFGGVHDVEQSEEGIDSEFFDGLFVCNIDRNRFYPLVLRRPRVGKKVGAEKAGAGGGGGRRGRGRADEEELLKNLARLEMKEGGASEADEIAQRLQDADEPDEPDRPEKPVVYTPPHPRFNAQLAVQDDTLYIFGGIFEKKDREFTFDEMWAVDLGKLDGVREIYRREIPNWDASDDEESDEDEDEDEDEEEDEGGSGDEMEVDSVALVGETTSEVTPSEAGTVDTEDVEDDASTAPSSADTLPYPRPFESLREFYARTSVEWQELVLADLSTGGDAMQASRSVKEVRKSAFDRAEQRWWDVREEVIALEDERTEAGIGEVVDLAQAKKEAGSGAGRRR